MPQYTSTKALSYRNTLPTNTFALIVNPRCFIIHTYRQATHLHDLFLFPDCDSTSTSSGRGETSLKLTHIHIHKACILVDENTYKKKAGFRFRCKGKTSYLDYKKL